MRVLIVFALLFLLTLEFSFTQSSLTFGSTQVIAPYQTPLCPSPIPADLSNQQISSSTSNITVPGHIVYPLKQHNAVFRTYLPSNLQLHLELVFKIRDLGQFQQCLKAINDPSSPYYEKFLNATTLEPFLPTPGQRASVIALLQRSGFTVSPGFSPLVLNLNADVKKIQAIFQLRLGLYRTANTTFFASNIDPQLPSNIAPEVSGILGLDNYTKPKPTESPCSGGSHPYCPQGVQVGYTFSTLIAAGDGGAGQTVAIVDEPGDPYPQQAITQYSTQYGLPAVTISTPAPDGTPTSYDPGWGSEAAMDMEAVHTTAPGAGIALIYIPPGNNNDLMDGVDYVATNHVANVVSNSWTYACGSGPCPDTQLPDGIVGSEDSRLAMDAAQGVTVVFASGDDGSNPGGSLGTEFPASDPNVLGVGATNLALTGCGTSTCTGYGSESGASISGGGYSGYFSEPSWQSSSIGRVKNGRGVPDVSMFGFSPNFWVYSTRSDRCGTGGTTLNSWFGCAGTSLSTPLWAGYLADIIQARGGTQLGNINPKLYQIASSTSYSSLFHDITSGSNGAYSASGGWDPVTGWGSPQANSLALAFSSTLTTNVASGSGSVSPNCPSGCAEVFGDAISVSATPSGGWVFSSWTITGASCSKGVTSAPCSFTMPDNSVTVGASFVETTSISLSVSPSSTTVGSLVQLTGSITPNPGTVQVSIGLSSDGGSTWSPLLFVNAGPTGAYSTEWTPAYSGSYQLQASWAGNSGFQGSISPTRGLIVSNTRPPTSTLLLTAPTSAAHGQTVQLTVTEFNPTTSPMSSQITIEILGPSNYVFYDSIQVIVVPSSYDTILYDWAVPTQTGTYTILVNVPNTVGDYGFSTITVN